MSDWCSSGSLTLLSSSCCCLQDLDHPVVFSPASTEVP